MGDGQLYDSVLRDGLNDAFSDAHSGWHTEDLVEKYQVTRDAQDRWALRSQRRFADAQAAGHFKAQIVPVEVPGKKGPVPFDKDEHNRCPFRKSYPRVAMMQSTQDGHSNDGTRPLDCSMQWRILVQ